MTEPAPTASSLSLPDPALPLADPVLLTLPLPEGYRADWVQAYYGRDRQNPSEAAGPDGIAKLIRLPDGRTIRLHLSIGSDRVVVRADAPVAGAALGVVGRVARRMLGLLHDPAPLEGRAASDPDVARLVAGRVGLRSPLTATVFEGLVWAIVGQQVNLTFAATLRRTVIDLAGSAHPGGGIAHPGPGEVAALDPALLTGRKFSRSKADYLIGVSRHIADGGLDLEGLPDLGQGDAEERLTGIRGIGPWTRQYVLMRACGFPDCAPVGDAGLAAALQRFHGMDRRPTPAEQAALMAPYAPFRSHATALLWSTLG
ncbi:MAG: hypothetical protein RLY86_4281 [Pseudomonadota bacterium]|jgi:3-methyladenine DNA glycosylase/8-oxoguanine DNA glycosylase